MLNFQNFLYLKECINFFVKKFKDIILDYIYFITYQEQQIEKNSNRKREEKLGNKLILRKHFII